MKFTKMHGCGNDYVYIDCTKEDLDNIPEIAIGVSNRNFGIGSDGLILIKSSQIADFTMDMYNQDGSRSQMCGNGIRCVGKYVYDYGLTDKTKITIETLAGIKELELLLVDGKVEQVTVNMGSPILIPAQIPVRSEKEVVIKEAIQVNGTEYEITCVSVGNPHAVVFVDDIMSLPLEKIGPLFENHPMFPERINTEFIKIVDRSHMDMRVWERGSGETMACGTGACASVIAAILNGLTDHTVEVKLPGGTLTIRYEEERNLIFMTGNAVKVFDGEIDLERLTHKD